MFLLPAGLQNLRLVRKSFAILHSDEQQNIVTIILFDPCLYYCIELPCTSLLVLCVTEIISLW